MTETWRTHHGDMPIQSSIRKELATYLAGSDPRCGHESHALLAVGIPCKFCRREFADYMSVVPMAWPR